jgi:hypothetical protein
MEVITITAGASPATASALGAAYSTKYGTPPVGKQLFLEVIPVKTGIQGAAQTLSAPFTAAT